MKIRPLGAELFQADGRTDGQTDRHDEANSCFAKFCDRAQNCLATTLTYGRSHIRISDVMPAI